LSVHRESHHLTEFVRRTFGEQFGAVLLAGYGEEAALRESRLHLTEPTGGGAEAEWQLVISGKLPNGRDPLVLAALLKLLLSYPPFTPTLEFNHEEMLSELGWPDTRAARAMIDGAIRKYLGLTFEKVKPPSGRLGGMYTLIISYDQASEIRREDGRETLAYNSVTFHPQFIERLNCYRITFAGLEFGELDPTCFLTKVVTPAT
jgi:hypothetical protein